MSIILEYNVSIPIKINMDKNDHEIKSIIKNNKKSRMMINYIYCA
jgi:hypothetical protein